MIRKPTVKTYLHPKNRHRDRYDFLALARCSPELSQYLVKSRLGDESIDFSDPRAVKALNRALLEHFYGVHNWDIPDHYLCPPIPGRADYIHHVAELLGTSREVKAELVRVLDIGCGANLIYPILGFKEYGWHFVASDHDKTALSSAENILKQNPDLRSAIQLRHQLRRDQIFRGIITPLEEFDLTICNPPFYSSLSEAHLATSRKWRSLGRSSGRKSQNDLGSVRNFSGKESELCYPGGEAAFISSMIKESEKLSQQCRWFTTLVSKESILPLLDRELARTQVRTKKVIDMIHGQKRSRILAWSYRNEDTT